MLETIAAGRAFRGSLPCDLALSEKRDGEAQTSALTIPGGASTTASIAVGGSIDGQIDFVGDADWYGIELVAGQSYLFTLTGTGASPLSDPYLELRDSSGQLISVDDDAGAGVNSLMRFTATVSGAYYLNARSYFDENQTATTGTYTLTATVGPPQNPLDSINLGFSVVGPSLTVYFASVGETFQGETATRNWTPSEIARAMEAFAAYSAVTPLTFTQTGSSAGASFVMTLASLESGVLGQASRAGGVGYLAFAPTTTPWQLGLAPGGLGFVTLIHEIGHGLGLAHPHDNGGGSEVMQGVMDPIDSYGTFELNQGVFTTMTYNDGWPTAGRPGAISTGNQATVMALDIALLQQKYGANASANSGPDTYVLPATNSLWRAIWDTGGTDEIVSNSADGSTIDLRPATLLNAVGGGGYVSSANPSIHGGFTIAAGVLIENAIGGSGADTLIGNSTDNQLFGGDGADLLIGGAGNDLLDGGFGIDIADFAGAASGVTADLQSAIANDGQGGVDALISIEEISASSFDDALRGDGLSNRFFGGPGGDALEGRGGDDTLRGEGGDDVLCGGPGNDLLDGGDGVDTADYSAAPGAITVGVGANSIVTILADGEGGTDDLNFIDRIVGTAFDDVINVYGGNYDVMIVGGPGNDSLTGGSVDYSGAPGPVSADLATGAADDGEGGVDTLAAVGRLIGSAFADELKGGPGRETLDGRGGDDLLAGGSGNDTYVVDSPGDAITEFAGDPFDWVQTTLSLFGLGVTAGSANVENLEYVGSGSFTGYGSAGDNYLVGAAGPDGFIAFDGQDYAYGGGGNDYAYGGDGDDLLFGEAGVDILLGENGDDHMVGGNDQDYIFGLADNDSLVGEAGVDVLIGDIGNDWLEGGEGNDYLYAGVGNDLAKGGDGADLFVMESGDDLVEGGAGDDFVYAGDGDDTIDGGEGTDILLGEAGNDMITGWSGVNYVFLGTGDDTYILDRNVAGVNVDVLYDFTPGAGSGDVLRLLNSGLTTLAQVQAAMTDTGNGYSILVLDADTQVWIIGVTPGQLGAGDVAFI